MIKEGYKMTEIGEIPEDWTLRQLSDKDTSEIVMGQSPPSSSYNTSGNGLPFFQGNADFGTIYPTPRIYCTKPLKISETNDILISVRAPVGEINIAPFKCIIGRGLAAIRSINVYGKFLYYYLKNNIDRLKASSSGSTFKAVSKNSIMEFKVALPPLPEQQKIAEILSTADNAIDNVNEQIILTEKLKKGLMQKLLTRGIGHNRFKMTEIGEIPEEWGISKLGDVTEIMSGGTPAKSKKEYWENGNIPWIKSGQCNDNLIQTSDGYITESGLKNSSARLLKPGTVLVAMVGYKTAGRTGLLMFEACTNQNVAGIIAKDPKSLMQKYLFYVLQTKYPEFNKNTGFFIANLSFIRNLDIQIPPYAEQQKITEILSTVDKKLEILIKKRESLDKLKKWLMDNLLTGKIKVKINAK